MNFVLAKADEILVTAGWDGNGLSETELVKIDEDGIVTTSSCQLPDYPSKVYDAKGTFLAQSKSNIVCGGYQATNECYKYDVNEWKKMPPMKIKRYDHGMTSTNDMIFVCGGYDDSNERISSCEEFKNGKWNSIQQLPTLANGHCMVSINNETIFSIGGDNGPEVRL